MAVPFVLFFLLLTMAVPLQAMPEQQQAAQQQCFAVSDESSETNQNTLIEITLPAGGVGQGNAIQIGEISGGGDIEAIALVPDRANSGEFTMYAANAGQFGEIEFTPGSSSVRFVPKGSLTPSGNNDDSIKGLVNGKQKSIRVTDVDSLTYDANGPIMYGVQRREGEFDILFKIVLQNLPGRLVMPNAFEGQYDFAEVRPAAGVDTGGLKDVDDIAIHPISGKMYAVINTRGVGGLLAELDPNTGLISEALEIKVSGTNDTINDIEGLAFSSENPPRLYGSTGDNGPPGFDQNQLFLINLESATAAQVTATSVAEFERRANDVEGLGCLTDSPLNPAITLEKSTNGIDADTQAEGPDLLAGWPVTWQYEVTNTGDLPLSGIALLDDKIGAIQCPAETLAVGGSMICSATGTVIEGAYRNVATVTALSDGGDVTATDPSHYTGIRGAIQIETSTNGQDADDPSGPQLAVGATVNWEYLVTNSGDAALTDIVVIDLIVTDNKLTANEIDCPTNSLAAGASMTCTASGSAVAGQHRIDATVTARAEFDASGACAITDTDPSHYFAGTPEIKVEKFTNGIDADTEAEGPRLATSCPVEWRYEVSNTGDLPLTNITLTDDKLGPILPCVDSLAAGESVVCTAPLGVVTEGAYRNLATVTGISIGGPVSDEDPSNYLGLLADVVIEKSTNGQDSDEAPGQLIPAGAPITWTYQITNMGQVGVSNIRVVDDQLAEEEINCGGVSTLAPGESMSCTATGTAIAGEYDNLATVLATPNVNVGASCEIDSSDPSHYKGVGDLVIGQSSIVGWSYSVTNTGQITLTDIVVDAGSDVTVTCPEETLMADTSMACKAQGPEKSSGNEAIVSAVDAMRRRPLTVVVPSIPLDGLAINLSINNELAADAKSAPTLATGSDLSWQALISNQRTDAVTGIAAEIINLNTGERQPLDCPAAEIAPGGSMKCTLSAGIALAGQNGAIGTVSGIVDSSLVVSSLVDSSLVADRSVYADAAGFYNGVTAATVGGRLFIDTLNTYGQANGLRDLSEGSFPAQGIEIDLYTAGSNELKQTVSGDNFDETGSYQFQNVEPGDYYMVVRRPAVEGDNVEGDNVEGANVQGFIWATPNRINDRLDSDADPTLEADVNAARTDPFTLDSGEVDRSWDLGFQQNRFTGIAFIDTNGNQKYDDGEVTIANATISATALAPVGQATDRTDSRGAYTLTDLTPSVYLFAATHPDYTLQIVASGDGTTVNLIAQTTPNTYLPFITSSALIGGK